MNPERSKMEADAQHREMLRVVSGSLQNETGSAMASAACMSRYHFQRVFERAVGEPPGALRRRLLLERAAYELRATKTAVTIVALDADYRSLEGFSRAFKRAFGLSPVAYRRAAQQIRLLPGTSGVHYHPRTASLTTQPGGRNMNLVDRLLEKDYLAKRRILACAQLLSDGQLDAPLAFQNRVVRFVDPPQTLRETLIHLFGNNTGGNSWVGGMYEAVGWQPSDLPVRTLSGNSPAAMLEGLEISAKTFHDFVRYVQEKTCGTANGLIPAANHRKPSQSGGLSRNRFRRALPSAGYWKLSWSRWDSSCKG